MFCTSRGESGMKDELRCERRREGEKELGETA
jgi:hypothetical protein